MAKELVLTNADCKEFAPLASGLVTRISALMDAGDEQGVITIRNESMATIRELQECIARAECFAKTAKTWIKHVFNHGSADELPNGVSWDKESYTYATNDAELIARDLIERGMCSDSQLMQQLTIAQIAKAAGMTSEGIVSKYPDIVTAKPKERVLRLK